MQNLLTLREAEQRLRVTRGTLYRWIAEGKLPALRTPAGQYRVRPEQLSALEPREVKPCDN